MEDKDNKNKTKIRLSFEEIEEIFEKHKKYDVLLEAKRMSTFYGDCFVVMPMTIHRDGIDKNLRGMTVKNMYVDDHYFESKKKEVDPPPTDIVTIIQSVNYTDLIKKISDARMHTHYYFDSTIFKFLEVKKEEKKNDTHIGKIRYCCRIPRNTGMHALNNTKGVSALKSRNGHR